MIEQQPSMDEILASIRRILSPETTEGEEAQTPPVVELTEAMCVPSQAPAAEMVEPPVEERVPVHVEEPVALPEDITALELPEHITFDEDEFFKKEATVAPEKTLAPQEPMTELPTETQPTPDSVLLGVLRPLLREWLDKNMPRLLESCIKQELKKGCNDSSSSF